jgi:hypothetical protein
MRMLKVLLLQCEYSLEYETPDSVKKMLNIIESMGSEKKTKTDQGRIALVWGRYNLKVRDFTAAGHYLAEALRVFSEIEDPFDRGKSHYYLGLLEMARGNALAGKEALGNALEIFTTLGAQAWQGKTEKVHTVCARP